MLAQFWFYTKVGYTIYCVYWYAGILYQIPIVATPVIKTLFKSSSTLSLLLFNSATPIGKKIEMQDVNDWELI